jgi:hypothetical protein
MPCPSKITQRKLDSLLADIHAHLTGSNWAAALRQLSSIKDYAMGEERLCSASAALRHCEQIRSYFPPTAPESVLKNIDSISKEIEQLQTEDAPDFLSLLLHPFAIATVGVVLAYWFFLR